MTDKELSQYKGSASYGQLYHVSFSSGGDLTDKQINKWIKKSKYKDIFTGESKMGQRTQPDKKRLAKLKKRQKNQKLQNK